MAGPTFVTAGGLRTDYIITRNGEAYTGLPGGNALYAAAGAALWADGVAPLARYGHSFPYKWLTELKRLGLKIQGLLNISGEHDHRTFYAYSRDGQRDDTNPAEHFTRFNLPLPDALSDYIHSTPLQDEPHEYEPLAPRPDDWPDSFANVTAVNLSPLPLAAHLQFPRAMRSRGIKQITLDPGERYMIPARIPYIRQMLPTINAFLPSDQEVRSLLGAGIDLGEAADTFCDWGARLVLIKIGSEGVLVRDVEQDHLVRLRPYHPPGDPQVIDVTGAGDAFCGGFMVGLDQTADPIQAAQMGLVSASLVIERYGALSALQINKEEAVRRLAIVKQQRRSL